MKFRLLVGSHIQWNPKFSNLNVEQIKKYAAEKKIDVTNCRDRSDLLMAIGAEQSFDAGQIVENDHDLQVRFGRNKFERLYEPNERPPAAKNAAPPPDEFESMTLADLRDHAAAEEIPLGEATTKREIITVLRSALVEAA